MESGDYEEAIDKFEALDGYKDSDEQIIEANYREAVALMESGDYKASYDKLNLLNDYKDSEEIKKIIREEYSYGDVGDTIKFGDYNGNTEWIVLAKEEGKILVISKYAIEKRPYNIDWVAITWETCTLRRWLNGTYLTSAFSSEEQARIVEASIVNSDNGGTDGGNNTTDKVFLLSIDEANKYFASNSEREASLLGGESAKWWLRSPSADGSYGAALVEKDGSVKEYGNSVDGNAYETVRPALWISFD